MTYCFYVAACLCLVIMQTTIFPFLPLLDSFYDLVIPFIVFLGLYRTVREGFITVVLLGIINDSISGSPFGYYLTAYCWLFIGVIVTKKIVHTENHILQFIVVATGVAIENLIFMGSIAILGPSVNLSAPGSRIAVVQTLWAVGSGFFILKFIHASHRRLDNLLNAMITRKKTFG